MGLLSFLKSFFYDEPNTVDRYKECWKCEHGEKFSSNDFSSYLGQGDYTNHVRCELFPCQFKGGIKDG